MRVGILGAGFQGVGVALELAARGVAVDLYDRHDACITQAGLRNEGKIHLGYTYAADRSLATARLMARGALVFDRIVARWLGTDFAAIGTSTPYDYLVHRRSMIEPDEIRAHFEAVAGFVRDYGSAHGLSYLGTAPGAAEVSITTARDGLYDPQVSAGVLGTTERAVDTAAIAAALRRRVAEEPRISFHPACEVERVAPLGNRLRLHFRRGGRPEAATCDQVVNCLWDGRLPVDQALGVSVGQTRLFRLKYTVRLRPPGGTTAFPTATIVLGRFGDLVRVDDQTLHLAWYPAGLGGFAVGTSPPDWPHELHGEAARAMAAASLAGLGETILPLRALGAAAMEAAEVRGCIIVAQGASDIDDIGSGLHQRSGGGVASCGRYHSVETSKYTLAPLFAREVADRICGEAGRTQIPAPRSAAFR